MLSQEVIELAQTECAALIVLALKKFVSPRFCVDCRKPKNPTRRDSYHILIMNVCTDLVGDATVFSTQDANDGYWQAKIEGVDRNETAFTCHHGIYRFVRMPSSLKYAPGTFQQTTDVTLESVKWQYAFVYLDGIVVFSESPERHIKHVYQVFTLL